MKKFLLVIYLIISVSKIYSQSTAETATRFTFNNYINYLPPIGTQMEPGPDYGCLSPGLPSWFYFLVCGKDDSVVHPNISINTTLVTVGLIIWGPFDDTTNIISKLTTTNIDTCITNASIFVELPYLQTGKFYYGMLSIDTAALHCSMSLNWTGGYWFDNRCNICSDRVANYKQEICMVTLDSTTQKNIIIWEKKYPYEVASYNIYRETIIAGQWDSIGNVSAMADGSYIDNAVNPFQRSYRYKVAGVDSCGQTTLHYNNNYFDSVANPHATIHTQASPGFNGEVNLSWNAYEGFSYNTFYIYRGSSAMNMQVIDSVASTTLSYTDYSPPTGSVYYKVTVRRVGGCSPDGGTTVYTQAFSNIPYAMITSVNEVNANGDFNIYPNPNNGSFSIILNYVIKNVSLRIYNMLGEIVYEGQFSGGSKIFIPELKSGFYTAVIAYGTTKRMSRFVVE